ncbi:MAG: sporulation protein YqfD [Anaerotruncus sp.]|jgi:similar to stage IV sporulation protein|nr:sporulation protein YqfD [Anaerotruncus sp.]
MPVNQIFRQTCGFVEFQIQAGDYERLLNLCAHHEVPLWDIRHTDKGFFASTAPQSYRDLCRLARKAGVKPRLRRRRGLPFVVYRYRARVGIIAGIVLFILSLLISQQFLWQIQVEGCERLEQQTVLRALESLGVRRGALKSRIQPLIIKQQMPLLLDDISWAALNIQGTTATLLVRERTLPPQKIDTHAPANVVAAMDGQLVRLEVTDGQAMRKKGDTVQKGELIASGVWEDRWGMTHLVRAKAVAIAHVPQSLTVEVPLLQEQLSATGEVVRRRYLEICGLRIPLFLYSKLEGEFQLACQTSTPKVFGVPLPFELSQEEYHFFVREQEEISEETALHLAQQQINLEEQQRWGAQILKSRYSASLEEGVLTLRGDYEVEMDIAQQVEIPLDDPTSPLEENPLREGGY